MRSRRDIDRAIHELAGRTLSVVHCRDLRANDVGRSSIANRIADGWIAPVVHRTYAVGPECARPTFQMQCMAGALAGGVGAVVTGATEALLANCWNRRVTTIHVAVPDRAVASVPPFRFHRQRGIWLPDEHWKIGPIPVAGGRDMLGAFSLDHTALQVAFVINRAIYRGLTTIESLEAYADQRFRARGNAVLRAAIALVRAHCWGTRSWTEDCVYCDLDASGHRPDVVNTRGALGIPRDEADFLWLGARCCNVEVDGGHHDEPAQAADDRARDEEVMARGCDVLRLRARDYWRRRRHAMRLVVDFVRGRSVPLVPGTRVLDVR